MKIRSIKVFGWCLSCFLIIFAVFYFDWRQILNNLKSVNLWFLPLLFLIYVFDYFLRTFRWKLLLYPVKKTVSFPKLFCSYSIAHFANIFLPVRAGELLRVFITGKEERISKRTIFGTLLFEKIFDILGIGVLIAIAIFFLKRHASDGDMLSTLLFWAPIFLIAPIVVILVMFLVKRFTSIKYTSAVLNRVVDLIGPVFQGFSSLKQLPLLLSVAVLSIFMWILNAFILYLYISALSFGMKYFHSIAVLLFQTLGEFVPSAPSSIGTFHASTVIGSRFVGLSTDQGLALGLLNHSYDIVIRVIFGLVSIHFINFDFRKGIQDVKSNAA